MKPPGLHHFAQLATDIRPLADFYRQFKPGQTVIRLFPAQYEMLRKYPQRAASYGFVFHGKQIYFGDYQLLMDAQHV